MNLQYVSPSKIKPYPKNAKKHDEKQIEALKKSITEFGFDQPIVLDKKNVIIKGHGRWSAACELELEVVPVIVADHLTPDQVKMARLVDNDVVGADWDDAMLRDDLIDIKNDGEDLSIACFTESEFENLLQATEEQPVEYSNFNVTAIATKYDCPKCGYRW